MLKNTIEDLILFICSSANSFDPKGLDTRNRSILYSVAAQLRRNLPLTSKQADLVIKIIRDNQHLYNSIPNLNFLLDFPNFKFPFRVIDTSRKIILDEEKLEIRVKYPFDQKINKVLDAVKTRRQYDISVRSHIFKLNENSIVEIIDNLKKFNFEIDKKLLEWYEEIKKISSCPDDYIPTADILNDSVLLKNGNKAAINYFNQHRKGEIVSDTFLAKFMGFLISDKLNFELSNRNINNLTTTIISNNSFNRYSISADSKYSRSDIATFINEASVYPTLIFLNDDETLIENFKKWISVLNENSIANNNISVLFRSENYNAFNTIVKEDKLNNFVDENTKVVFVKNKIPKILYKLDFKPKLIITSNTFYVHYTGQKMVDSHPLVLYYTETSHQRMHDKFVKL